MINRVVLVGRLTRDPELKKTNSGMAVCSFTVAVDNRQKEPDGTRGTTFINCTAFQNSADNLSKFTRKGSLVGVEGRLNQRKFTRQDGTKGSTYEILCDSVQFLDSKNANASINESNNSNNETFDDVVDETAGNNLEGIDLPDDDLPF